VATRVDGIVSSFRRTISKLEKATEHHLEHAILQGRFAKAATELQKDHQAEADRAVAIRRKLEDLIVV
jgi:hypothetical protein